MARNNGTHRGVLCPICKEHYTQTTFMLRRQYVDLNDGTTHRADTHVLACARKRPELVKGIVSMGRGGSYR